MDNQSGMRRVNKGDMQKLVLTITIIVSGLAAQSISNVDFTVQPGNLIEVSYTLTDREPNAVYSIDVYASLDGGYSFPIKAESVTGDVGRVKGTGRKGLLWKVMNDMPALVSDNLVIKVVGRPQITVGGVFRSLFVGNRMTKRLSNGVTFYGGNGGMETQSHEAFARQVENGTLEPGNEFRFGLRSIHVPIIYRFEGRFASWRLHSPANAATDTGSNALTYLAFGDEDYNGGNLDLSYVGVAFGVSYTPLPVFGIFLPQIGGGVSYNMLSLGKFGSTEIAATRNPSVYAEAAVQVNLLRWLKFNIGVRQDFMSPKVNFGGVFMEAGLHIPGG